MSMDPKPAKATSSRDGFRSSPMEDDYIKMRTQKCINEIIKRSSKNPARVIILIGRTGVGKSALLEHLTGASGHSRNGARSVTLNFEIECADISGKRYYIMDTPGFDTDRKKAVFNEIVRGINTVRLHAKVVGIMLVERINENRDEAIDHKLVGLVSKLCGPEYAPQITVTTTFWSTLGPEQKARFEEALEERLQQRRGILGEEVMQYQHGQSLNWYKDVEKMKKRARAMICSHYSSTDDVSLLIVQELSTERSSNETAAAKFLGIAARARSSPTITSSSSSSDQASEKDSASSTSGSVAEGIPTPSASNCGTDTNHRLNSPQIVAQGPSSCLKVSLCLEVSESFAPLSQTERLEDWTRPRMVIEQNISWPSW